MERGTGSWAFCGSDAMEKRDALGAFLGRASPDDGVAVVEELGAGGGCFFFWGFRETDRGLNMVDFFFRGSGISSVTAGAEAIALLMWLVPFTVSVELGPTSSG